MKIKGFLGDIDINPKDHRELALVKNFRTPESGIKLNVDSLEIVREAYDALIEHLYTTVGRFENPPATITTDSGTIINSYLDLKDVNIGLKSADIGIGVRKSHGHFFTDSNVLTFELLAFKGFLPNSMRIKVPYIIVPDDLRQQRAILIFQSLNLLYQILDVAYKIAAGIAQFLDLGYGILAAIAQLLALLIMLAAVIINLIQTLSEIKELYFPKLREFKAVRDLDLIRQGCQYLGYTLESDLLNIELRKLCTMGVPQAVASRSIFDFFQNEQTQFFNKGYPTAQDRVSTLGGLIKFITDTYDARVFVYNGIVKIERRAYFVGTASIILKPTLTDQQNHEDFYKLSDKTAWGRTYDHWEIDYTDIHSPDTYDGMKSEHITEPIVTFNPDLVRLVGLKENAAPFALAARKNGLTRVEKLAQNIFGLFGTAIGSSDDPIEARLGVMMISQQYFSSTKKLWLDVSASNIGKQPLVYKLALSMDTIYTTFKTGLEVINNNFAEKTMIVPFTDENFISLQMNNFVIYEPTGQVVELENIEWFDRKWKAKVEILLPDSSAFNTKTTKLA